MAVPVFNGNHVSIFAWDAFPDPTRLYIYARGTTTGEMRHALGWKKPDGTFQDGYFTDACQLAGNFAAGNDAIDMGTAGFVVGEDTNQYSPHEGEYRLEITLSASAA